ncbi:hypothetical protein DL95DRAFT_452718 [Leptodontidium sp. 2 PMI_412]|nr:hypothetical protein DL95DRAFT_452718 [Leptodontidium sp. 2 PMI_412]
MPSFAEVRQYLGGQIFGKPFVPRVDLSGTTYVITGGNTGLGLECAKHLQVSSPQKSSMVANINLRANLKAAKIILACRNLEKGSVAKNTLLKLTPHATIENLHGFIANAGLETVTFERTERYENSLTVNVISTIMLSVLALPKLKETAKKSGAHTNLVIVGSMQHVFAPSGQLDVGEGKKIFETLSDEKTADMMARYELSKLMVQMCQKEIAERVNAGAKSKVSPVVVNCVNPGWCATELSRYYDKGRIVGAIFSMIGRTAEAGSRTLVRGVTAGEETHGQYLSEYLVKTESTFVRSREGYQIQKRLWKELSEIIERLSPGSMAAM